ncbi:hypothetical protein V9T40_010308 [Parthenolecanium corni]|uniref:Dihydropteridine reductase n=1 Tax=Parthenolecanium corni TaxID=536013 RepID=A0AAN9TAA2_9HEMI
MSVVGRRNCIPIVYVKGTYYEVGFDVGRTFKGLIQEFVKNCGYLNDEFVPLCSTPEGKKLYEDTLKCVRQNFPQYIRELEGLADGSEVPFNKLFLLHMGDMIPTILGKKDCNDTSCGCSTICCNEPNAAFLGHTEDSMIDTLGYFYFVSAHIIEKEPQGKWKTTEERFVSLCYAGYLPGFTMNYNHHGLVYSINVIHARDVYAPKTPEYFLCRALLSASNLTQVENILKDKGCGSAVGFSVNVTFLDEPGDRLFYNFEVGPSSTFSDESLLNKICIKPGEHYFHCNKYLRLKVKEVGGLIVESSDTRHQVFEETKPPKTKKEVIKLLSHQREDNFTIYRDAAPTAKENIVTIAIGIFDCIERTWSIYAAKPEENEPLVVLPLHTLLKTNVDSKPNDIADVNIIVNINDGLVDQEGSVLNELKNHLKENVLDAVICVAGGWAGGNASSNDFAKNCELTWKQSVVTSVIASSVAAKFLKEGGLLTLTGASGALAATPGMIGYGMAKASVHHLTKTLAAPGSGLPTNCTAVAILPETLDTPMNRKWMPKADTSSWTSLDFVSSLFLKWSDNVERPVSGSLVKLRTTNNSTEIQIV